MKGYIFGDVGGHANAFFASLRSLGVNTQTGEIPDGIHIVQIGDLIHKGPDSQKIISLLKNVMQVNPDKWTQIIGNHEAMHLGMTFKFVRCSCDYNGISHILRRLQGKGMLSLALGVSGEAHKALSGETLITHAGMTKGVWLNLDSPESLQQTVHDINASPEAVLRAGSIVGGSDSLKAGVFWATCNEVYKSWNAPWASDDIIPFNMIHGHTIPYGWNYGRWHGATPKDFRQKTNVYQDRKITVCHMTPTVNIVGVDPGYTDKCYDQMQPYLTIEDFSILN